MKIQSWALPPVGRLVPQHLYENGRLTISFCHMIHAN
jgi:hypothetical protein